MIWGLEEPDEYVMYGNHRDAWVYGAVDPSSGTSCMMEITRIYGEMLKNGWKPRRLFLELVYLRATGFVQLAFALAFSELRIFFQQHLFIISPTQRWSKWPKNILEQNVVIYSGKYSS